MEESGNSPDYADNYSSSYSSDGLDSISLSMGQSWSNYNQPASSHLPPPTSHRPNLALPARPPPPSTTNCTTTYHSHPNHSRGRSPRQRSPPHQQHIQSREPAHFDLPNFPLPTASINTPHPTFPGQIDSIFDLPSDWPDWDGVISSRPASRVSSRSEDDAWDIPFSRTETDFVDLTDDSHMSTAPKKRKSASTAGRSLKRRKTDSGVKKEQAVKDEDSDIEQLDLIEVEDDDELSKTVQKQQEMAIKAQQKENGDKPTKVSDLQCIICLERMTDMVVTSCGHPFCHGCLMEALIAGEQQEVEPGKFNSRCPVCRKKVNRPKPGTQKSEIIMLEFMKKKAPPNRLKVSITD